MTATITALQSSAVDEQLGHCRRVLDAVERHLREGRPDEALRQIELLRIETADLIWQIESSLAGEG